MHPDPAIFVIDLKDNQKNQKKYCFMIKKNPQPDQYH
jgi:hypothetical protein